jgi:small subunit ribosomal protein S6
LREYESMLILPAEADEATVSTATDRISAVAAKHSGQVSNIERWGRRRLAYELDHRNEGYYVVVTFSASPAAQAELERTLNLADEVLRYKVMVLPPVRDKQVRDKQARDKQAPVKQLTSSPVSAAGGDETPQGE